MEIKICGLTKPEEADYLNEHRVDYAGFVLFFEKSKRCVTLEQAQAVYRRLDKSICRVAVTVSPTVEQVKEIEAAGFDILQVHKRLEKEVLETVSIPVWYAFNIADSRELVCQRQFLAALPEELSLKIAAIVVDSSNYGSGQTFDWEKSKRLHKSRRLKKAGAQSPPEEADLQAVFEKRRFILAGGLTPENVAEGIRIFEPDIVDVSSGVEGSCGKDESLIRRFVSAVHK